MLVIMLVATRVHGFGSEDLERFDQAIQETKVSMVELFEDRHEDALDERHDQLMYRLYLIYTLLLDRNSKSSKVQR